VNLTFREKSYWASLLIMSFVWINYFLRIQPALVDGSITRADSAGLFAGALATLIILEIVVHVALAVTDTKTANQPGDERDAAIGHKSANFAGRVLGFCVVLIGALAMFGNVSSVLTANLLLLALVLSQCVDYALSLFYYRRGW
jgi:hypothetical protein